MTIDINELRRLAQAAMTGPDGVSLNWVKLLQDFQKEASPAAVSELLDRLELAEKSDAESIAMYRKARDERDALRAKVSDLMINAAFLDNLKKSYEELIEELQDERDRLRAKIEVMKGHPPYVYIDKILTEVMDIATANGADSRSMPDEYVEVAAWLCGIPGAQPAPKAVAYLDLGVGGYMDIGTDLTDEQLASLPKGRHMLGIVGTYGVDGYVSAQPAPALKSENVSFIDTSRLEGVVSTEIVHSYPPPSGWLRAIDEALAVAHIGVANESDTYEQAKTKLDTLIGFHIDVATDPAVNGGYKLVPIVSTYGMENAGSTHCDGYMSTAQKVWDAMIAVAPAQKEKET